MENKKIFILAKKLGTILKKKNMSLSIAESCTGGLLSAAITEVAGCSNYFKQCFVVYSNQAKIKYLGVKPNTIKKYGAVSIETAKEMAIGTLFNSRTSISISITGIAGPTGGSSTKKIGTVCFSLITPKMNIKTKIKRFIGDRYAVRVKSVIFALRLILDTIK